MIGHFNANISKPTKSPFRTLSKLKTLAKKPICYKNPEIPSCVDLFLTNFVRTFHNTCVFDTVFLNFQKLILTILQSKYDPPPPKIIRYRTYILFDKQKFKTILQAFLKWFLNAFTNFLLFRKKYFPFDHYRFITKDLTKTNLLKDPRKSQLC